MQLTKFSTLLLSEIKKAKHILLNVHKSPDLDSVGSACAFSCWLLAIGKEVTIVSPGPVDRQFSFIKGYETIKSVQFDMFDYSPYDLFILLDVSSFDRVTGSKKIALSDNLNYAVIDHHTSNQFTFPIKYINEDAHSTTEILFELFCIWRIVVTPQTATALYAGLAGDTVHFRYMNDAPKVFQIAQKLLALGADHVLYMKNIYNSYEAAYLKLLGKFLEKMEVVIVRADTGVRPYSFVWSGVSYEEFILFGQARGPAPTVGVRRFRSACVDPYVTNRFSGVREAAADNFFRSVAGTQFGCAILETKKGEVSVSFRSNAPFDVSVYARALGGGGHAQAAGCTLLGKYEEIVKQVLSELGKGKG